MKTCNDCLHCNVCEKRTCSECQSSYCDECGIYSEYDGRASVENCTYFKDKSLVFVLPCKKGDLVYELVLCDDGKYRIFDMRVGKVVPYGSLYNDDVWNLYLVGTYTYAYKSFYDFGKTVFLTREAAEQALKGGAE